MSKQLSKWEVSLDGVRAATPQLSSIFTEAGVEDAEDLASNIQSKLEKAFETADSVAEASRIGKSIHQELVKRELVSRFDELFMVRNFRMANSVRSYLEKDQRVLDVQTGNGWVATMLSEMRPDCDFSLTDDIDERGPMCKRLPWVEKPSGQYDTLLFLAVLHHAADPTELFRQYTKHLRSGGTVIIVENTFKEGDKGEEEINIFFDWFFHNCVHPSDYPCPNTHKSIEEWTKFLKDEGFKIKAEESLGRFPMVKVIHHLWVGRKK